MALGPLSFGRSMQVAIDIGTSSTKVALWSSGRLLSHERSDTAWAAPSLESRAPAPVERWWIDIYQTVTKLLASCEGQEIDSIAIATVAPCPVVFDPDDPSVVDARPYWEITAGIEPSSQLERAQAAVNALLRDWNPRRKCCLSDIAGYMAFRMTSRHIIPGASAQEMRLDSLNLPPNVEHPERVFGPIEASTSLPSLARDVTLAIGTDSGAVQRIGAVHGPATPVLYTGTFGALLAQRFDGSVPYEWLVSVPRYGSIMALAIDQYQPTAARSSPVPASTETIVELPTWDSYGRLVGQYSVRNAKGMAACPSLEEYIRAHEEALAFCVQSVAPDIPEYKVVVAGGRSILARECQAVADVLGVLVVGSRDPSGTLGACLLLGDRWSAGVDITQLFEHYEPGPPPAQGMLDYAAELYSNVAPRRSI